MVVPLPVWSLESEEGTLNSSTRVGRGVLEGATGIMCFPWLSQVVAELETE